MRAAEKNKRKKGNFSEKKTFSEIFAKRPLRFFFLGVYSYLSMAMTATTTADNRFRAESQKRKRK
jgi:hypothetical protein